MLKIGHSYDVHRFEVGKGFILGGEFISAPFMTVAHSDGDVLAHVVTEAILGALGKGDIGTIFPDTDKTYEDANSMEFVKVARDLLKEAGFKINNIDTCVYLQTPKLTPYKEKIRQNLAQALELDPGQVNVKATTGEKVGFIGRSEAIAAEAVVLIEHD